MILLAVFAVLAADPNPSWTPGAVNPAVTAREVCVSGYTRTARHVTEKQKRAAHERYGAIRGCCEVDHLVSLELGGSNADANLWAQPWPEAREKDRVENYLHWKVCHGEMSLTDAQKAILAWREWLTAARAAQSR